MDVITLESRANYSNSRRLLLPTKPPILRRNPRDLSSNIPILGPNRGRGIKQPRRIIPFLQGIQPRVILAVKRLLEVGLVDVALGHVRSRPGGHGAPSGHPVVGHHLANLLNLRVGRVGRPCGGKDEEARRLAPGRVDAVVLVDARVWRCANVVPNQNATAFNGVSDRRQCLVALG